MVYSYLRSFSWFKCPKLPSFLTENHMQIHWATAGLHKFRIFGVFFSYVKFSSSEFSVSVIYLIHPATESSESLEVSSTSACTSGICLSCKSVPLSNVHHAALNTATGQCKPWEHAVQESLQSPDTQGSPSTSNTEQASGVGICQTQRGSSDVARGMRSLPSILARIHLVFKAWKHLVYLSVRRQTWNTGKCVSLMLLHSYPSV